MSDQNDQGPKMAGQQISDETLLAYLDGALPAEERAAIDEVLRHAPAVRERLDLLRAGDRPFRESFDHLLQGAPNDRLQELLASAEASLPPAGQTPAAQTPANDSGPAPWLKSGALVACLLLAVGLGYLGGTVPGGSDTSAVTATLDPEDAWRLAVAEYQVLYTRETLANLDDSPPAQQAGLDRVGTHLGLALPPDSIQVADLEFKRAQILRFGDQPLAQLAYLHADRIPIAFCITGSQQPDQAPQAERLKGLNVVHWVKDGFAYMVIGDLPDDQLGRIGQHLSEEVG